MRSLTSHIQQWRRALKLNFANIYTHMIHLSMHLSPNDQNELHFLYGHSFILGDLLLCRFSAYGQINTITQRFVYFFLFFSFRSSPSKIVIFILLLFNRYLFTHFIYNRIFWTFDEMIFVRLCHQCKMPNFNIKSKQLDQFI